VQPPSGKLAAAGVERELAVPGDPLAALDERSRLALAAHAERLEPHERQDREAVVDPGDVDVAHRQGSVLPQGPAGISAGHRREVLVLVPVRPPAQRRAVRGDPEQRRAQVRRGVSSRHDDRRAAVHRDVAVEQAQRVGDHTRVKVLRKGERLAEDRLGVERGVGPLVDSQRAKLLARCPVLVEVPPRDHRRPVRRRDRTERDQPLLRAVDAVAAGADDGGAPARGLRRALPHRTEAQHMVRQPRRHRRAAVDDRAELPGRLDSAVEPGQREPERVLDVPAPHPGEPGRGRERARPGRDAVDVRRGQPGVGDRLERRVHGEGQRRSAESPADLRLPDAADQRVGHRAPSCAARVKQGSHTSSFCSNMTLTLSPMRTSAGSTPTSRVDTRSKASSSSSTIASVYGTGTSGIHGW